MSKRGISAIHMKRLKNNSSSNLCVTVINGAVYEWAQTVKIHDPEIELANKKWKTQCLILDWM